MFGSFSQLTQKIRDYLTARDPGDLFQKILARLEDDFEASSGRPDLVRDATSAIWCSSRGMAEDELREFLDVSAASSSIYQQ